MEKEDLKKTCHFHNGILPNDTLKQDQKFKIKTKSGINSWDNMHDRN
jgi:hypothetical protein